MVQSSAPWSILGPDGADGLQALSGARFHVLDNLRGILHDKTPIKLRVTLMVSGVADSAHLGGKTRS
jgi:hypothetical protein